MSKNMAEIFTKLTELKNIFLFAEKIVPIVQSLIEFMQEMTPLLETINSSIMSSTNQMKQGADRISDVTNATEMATTEILDLVDEISNSLMDIENQLNSKADKFKNQLDLITNLKELVKENTQAIEIINKLESEIKESIDISEISKIIATINENSYKITLSLQVQDITAQQLASVNHLIESVQSRLGTLISEIDSTNINEQVEELTTTSKENLTFDPQASYTDKDGKQDKVDDVINQQKEQASQDEIDKLFS